MNNKLAGLLVIKRDNHENRCRRTSDTQSIKLNSKNKLDLTVLLILRLLFPSNKYKSLAKPAHDENSKEKIREEGRERRLCQFSIFQAYKIS